MLIAILVLWQAFSAPLPPVDLTWITGGQTAETIWVDVEPGPGERIGLLIWLPYSLAVTVAVVHPSRSGYAGWAPFAGICYEPWVTVPLSFGTNTGSVGDVTGDGVDDFTVRVQDGLGQRLTVFPGAGLRYCR